MGAESIRPKSSEEPIDLGLNREETHARWGRNRFRPKSIEAPIDLGLNREETHARWGPGDPGLGPSTIERLGLGR